MLCVLMLTSAAAAQSPREYPATYSSRKAPWYDPFRIFTSPPKATVSTMPAPMPVVSGPMGGTSPAWQWYGYGSPAPSRLPSSPPPMRTYAPVATIPSEPILPPTLPTVAAREPDWRPPARMTPPAIAPAAPLAKLGAPRPADPVPGSELVSPHQNSATPDIPVVSAPGIVIPPK